VLTTARGVFAGAKASEFIDTVIADAVLRRSSSFARSESSRDNAIEAASDRRKGACPFPSWPIDYLSEITATDRPRW
jgi:hypothetical protein